MPGIKTKNKYTCADCKNHQCNCTCAGGKHTCDGRCSVDGKRIKCTIKICSNFVLDKLIRMC